MPSRLSLTTAALCTALAAAPAAAVDDAGTPMSAAENARLSRALRELTGMPPLLSSPPLSTGVTVGLKGPIDPQKPAPPPHAVNLVAGFTRATPAGAVAEPAVSAALVADQSALELCAHDAFAHRPGLSGSLTLALHVTASGAVDVVTPSASSLGGGNLTQCLVGRAQTWKLAAHGPADVTIALSVRNPNEPKDIVSATHGGSVRALVGQMRIDGAGRPGGDVVAFVRARFPAIGVCYEYRIRRSPTVGGRIDLTLRISDGGRLSLVRIARSTVVDSELEACVIGAVNRWRFAPPSGGDVDVTLPLWFVPAT